MRIKTLIVLCATALALFALAEQVEVTTTEVQVFPTTSYMGECYFVTIENTGDETVFYRANVDSAVATNMIPISAGGSYSKPSYEGRRGVVNSIMLCIAFHKSCNGD